MVALAEESLARHFAMDLMSLFIKHDKVDLPTAYVMMHSIEKNMSHDVFLRTGPELKPTVQSEQADIVAFIKEEATEHDGSPTFRELLTSKRLLLSRSIARHLYEGLTTKKALKKECLDDDNNETLHHTRLRSVMIHGMQSNKLFEEVVFRSIVFSADQRPLKSPFKFWTRAWLIT